MLSYCFSNIVSFLALHINILRMFEYIDLGLRIWKLYASKVKLDKQYQSSTHIINNKYWKVIEHHNAEITIVHSKWRLSSVSYYSWSPKLLTKFIILCQGFWEIIFNPWVGNSIMGVFVLTVYGPTVHKPPWNFYPLYWIVKKLSLYFPWILHLDVTFLVDSWSYVSLLVLAPIMVVVPWPFFYDDLTFFIVFIFRMTTSP